MIGLCFLNKKDSLTKKHIRAYASDSNVEEDGSFRKNSFRK